MAALPPLPADDGSCRIEIYGPPIEFIYGTLWNACYWSDNAIWGGWKGEGLAWQDVTPKSVNAQITWGTDDPNGCMSIVAAGSWSITTYDPERLLDPSNWWSRLGNAINPGGLIRIRFKDEIVRHGFIDEVEYDLATQTGSIRASDGISLMANAKIQEGTQYDPTIPNTLRARARWVLERASVKYIKVEDDPADEYDPVVGMLIDREASAWQQINTAAFDCLYACWLDRQGVLRFRSFGKPVNDGVVIGGPSGIAIDTVKTRQTLEGVTNHAIGTFEDWNSKILVHVKNQQTIDIYGDLSIHRDRQNPLAGKWATHVVDDRGAFKTQYEIGTIRPQTDQQLLDLLDIGMVSQVWLRATSIEEAPLSVDVRVLGGRIEANVESGWSAGLITYQPSTPWVPGEETNFQTSRYDVTKNREIYTTNVGGNYGRNGNPMSLKSRDNDSAGNPSSETTIILLDVPPIDWTGITRSGTARMRLFGYPHEHVPDDPTQSVDYVQIYRITAPWDEATIYPGPAKAEIEYIQLSNRHIGWIEFDISSIFLDWAPVAIGGKGLAQYGIALRSWYEWYNPPLHYEFNDRSTNAMPYIRHWYDRVPK